MSSSTQEVVLFIFRRDYRLKDNLALHECMNYSRKKNYDILPVFIIDTNQVNGSYFSSNSFQFLAESLDDLDNSLDKKLVIFKSKNTENQLDIFTYVSKEFDIKAVYSNRDYTPYANERDEALMKECVKRDIKCVFNDHDYTLLPLNRVLSKNRSVYKVFTPFYNTASTFDVQKVKNFYERDLQLFTTMPSNASLTDFYDKNEHLVRQGGRESAWKQLKRDHSRLVSYANNRDFPYKKSTSMMSAYLKYGCISVREFYWYVRNKLGKNHELIRQLYWKEFYAYIAFHFPRVLRGMNDDKLKNQPFRSMLKGKILWENNETYFKAWCTGRTGFPIVDAGMRQLNKTGFMHNRLRMITSMFLTKHLHIDWRWGEKYFATKLMDYDPASNNGGWQWSAGTGTDFNNYYRMFNPWTQTERFDIQCKYIKEWVLELKDVSVPVILKWYQTHELNKGIYIAPIVDHKEQRDKTMNEVYLR